MTIVTQDGTVFYFFFNDTATTEIYTLSLHDALPIWGRQRDRRRVPGREQRVDRGGAAVDRPAGQRRDAARHPDAGQHDRRSEEHTSELQSRQYLVCRLLLEKKK